MERSAPALAPRVALLTGAEEPPHVVGFQWEAVPLPSGEQRFLRLVSRETLFHVNLFHVKHDDFRQIVFHVKQTFQRVSITA